MLTMFWTVCYLLLVKKPASSEQSPSTESRGGSEILAHNPLASAMLRLAGDFDRW